MLISLTVVLLVSMYIIVTLHIYDSLRTYIRSYDIGSRVFLYLLIAYIIASSGYQTYTLMNTEEAKEPLHIEAIELDVKQALLSPQVMIQDEHTPTCPFKCPNVH